ncbi:MAG: LAGLIDADG family homing endonuclease [Pyrinomonadaceae bacterium]
MEEHEIKLIAYMLSDSSALGSINVTTAQDKAVPDVIFCLPRAQMALFLKVIFSCDGSVYIGKHDQPGVSYSTISKRLAEDLQHLLLRFGFTPRLRTKSSTLNGLPYIAYELQMLGESVVKRFISEIGIWGRDKAKTKILSCRSQKRHQRGVTRFRPG